MFSIAIQFPNETTKEEADAVVAGLSGLPAGTTVTVSGMMAEGYSVSEEGDSPTKVDPGNMAPEE